MPIVCRYKPNRSHPRPFRPSDLTRIYDRVCQDYGPGAAADAVASSKCANAQIDKDTLEKTIELLENLALAWGALTGTIVGIQALFRTRIWRWLLRFAPSLAAIEGDVEFLAAKIGLGTEGMDTAVEGAATIAEFLRFLP